MRHWKAFVGIALLLALLCIRLGFWQLDRLDQRVDRNAAAERSLAAPPVPFRDLPADTTELRFRRAWVAGVADYANEVMLTNRTRQGAPGVHLFTPVRIPGRDTAVLVNRGWVYAPDGTTPTKSWKEPDTVRFEGFVGVLAAGGNSPALAGRPRAITRATTGTMLARIPYPVDVRYLVATSPPDSGRTDVPARVPPPAVNDRGPHLGYALQWFTFALIALVGAGIAYRTGRQKGA